MSESETDRRLAERRDPDALAKEDEELPVVARMVVEIRSDGSRTIARGAAEDPTTGEKVALRVDGTTPLQLALSLMKTMTQLPGMALSAAKAARALRK